MQHSWPIQCPLCLNETFTILFKIAATYCDLVVNFMKFHKEKAKFVEFLLTGQISFFSTHTLSIGKFGGTL